MKVVDIADEIFRELDMPSTTSVPAIAFWLTSNIGTLNTLLILSVSVTHDEQFSPELSYDEKDIFKQLYFVSYYTRLTNSNLGAAAFDASVLEVTEGNRTVRLVNRNEVAKVWAQQKTQAQGILNDMVNYYRSNRATPRQVVDGNDGPVVFPYPVLNTWNYRQRYDLE